MRRHGRQSPPMGVRRLFGGPSGGGPGGTAGPPSRMRASLDIRCTPQRRRRGRGTRDDGQGGELKFGLAGFAGSGKTTLFNALTGLDVPAGYGGEVRLGAAPVADPRVDFLSAVFAPRKTTHASVNLCDVPGDHGAAATVLQPKTLQRLREQDAICLVLADFHDPASSRRAAPPDALAAFHEECLIADLAIVERRLDRARKERADGREIEAFETMAAALGEEMPLRLVPPVELDRRFLKGYGLLTELPLLVAVNKDESRAAEPLGAELTRRIEAAGGGAMALSAHAEAEIATLDPQDRRDFLDEIGLAEPALARFARTAYELMGLISFFTVGEDEVRAWTIRRGTPARAAAGRIHSDLERGFIRAEVTPYDVFAEHGSEQAVKAAGKMRIEGKDYVVADGDIMHVRFNV